MRAILFTDIHFGLSQDSPHFYKITLDFGDWLAKVAKERDIKTLICGGDIFHNRKSVLLPTINSAHTFFDKLKDFNVKILTGNHDCYYLDNSTVHSLAMFKGWKNIEIYDSPHYETIDGQLVGYMPWGTSVEEMKKCDIMFGHFEINGFQMGPSSFCKDKMKATDLIKKCPLIFSGHFHKPQINKYSSGEIVYMGSPYQHNWGEKGQDKYIYDFNFRTKKYEKIENTLSPKHIELYDGDDVSLAEGNIVKLYSESKTSNLSEEVAKLDTVQVESIIETKEIKEAVKTIKDFKGVDVLSSFKEVIKTMKGVDKKMGKKLNLKCKDYYEKVNS